MISECIPMNISLENVPLQAAHVASTLLPCPVLPLAFDSIAPPPGAITYVLIRVFVGKI